MHCSLDSWVRGRYGIAHFHGCFQNLTKTTAWWQKCLQKWHIQGCPFALSLSPVAAICFSFLYPNIYNSIYNLHSLLILCFLKAVFTKAIYILNTTSLHRVLVRAWFSLASFGAVWWSDTQAHPANALAHILSPDTSTGMPPIQKFLGGVKVVASKSDFLLPPCEMLLWEPICHMERNHHLHTHRPVHIHAHHAEVGEKANYPLCEWVCVPWSNVSA